jgi:TP901 family phage tail tape measure protein
MNMVDNLTGPMSRVQSSVGGSVSKLEGLQQTFGGMTKVGATVAGVGAQITDAALSPVKATFDTKRALGELSSMGVKDLKTLEKAATDFSNTWAGTTKPEFLSAAVDIKGGIDSLNEVGIAKYTEIAGVTAKATGSTIDEMTSLFATGYGIYKDFYSDLSDIEFAEIFSAGMAQAILTFKASGSSMAESVTALGGAATTANVPLEEQLSILGMLQATMSGSEAGTKYRAFLRTAAKAGDELGLSFIDSNKQLRSMPEILGILKSKYGETLDAMEKQDIQSAFGSDEAVALIDLMYSKTGDLQKNILTLYDSMGKGTAVTQEMANAINQTEPDRYETLTQRIHNVTESIGNTLLPTYNKMVDKGSEVLANVSDWIDKNQDLVRNIMLVVLGIGIFLTVGGTLVAVIGGVGLVFTKTAGFLNGFRLALMALPGLCDTIYIKALYAGDGLKKGFSNIKSFASTAVSGIRNVAGSIASMAKTAAINGANALKNMALGLVGMAKQAIRTAVTAMPGLISSVWGFTSALLANPVTWIVIGIVALIAAIILLWQNWDTVVAWIQGVWNGFVDGIKAGFDWIKNLFSGMPLWLQIAIAAFMPFIGIPLLIITHWDTIVAFFKGLMTRVKGAFVEGIDNVKTFISGLPEWFRNSGAKIIHTLVDGIKSAASAPVDAVKGIFKNVRKLLPFSDAKEGPLSDLTLSGHRTMTTIAEGIEKGDDIPYQAVEKGLGKIDTSSGRKPLKKIDLREVSRESRESVKEKESDKGITIDKFVLTTDFSKIKELPQLFKLIKEIEDYINSNGTPMPGEG